MTTAAAATTTVAQLQAELADTKAMHAEAVVELARFPRCVTALQYQQRDALEADKCRYQARIDEVTAELHRLGIYTDTELARLSAVADAAENRAEDLRFVIAERGAAGIATTSLERQLKSLKERAVAARGRATAAQERAAAYLAAQSAAETVPMAFEIEEVA